MLKILKSNGTFFEPKFFTFNGGEEFVSIEGFEPESSVTIYAQITSSTWLIRLLMLHDALSKAGQNYVNLFIPYLPYARQDRVCHPGQSFSLEVFADLIKGKFIYIETCDVHSLVALKLIPNLINKPQHTALPGVQSRLGHVDYIVAPDAGATTKAKEWFDRWTRGETLTTQFIQASKKRNEKGEITETVIDGVDWLLPNSSCLIVDDICDGGRTFAELAKVLREKSASKVYLFVTHGILANGIIGTGCDKVFTTDSLPEKDDGRIIVKRFLY